MVDEGTPVKITPVDIQHKQFKKSLQGYAREEVDTFLDEIIETMEQDIEERGKLEAQIVELQDKMAQFKAMEDSLQSALILAQRTADEVKASAHKEADLIKQRSKLELDQELGDMRARIADARRDLQRQYDQIAAAKQDLRALLARHGALLDADGVGAAPSPPLALHEDATADILFHEST
ncbi:MAG: DivIVA domain-containing protein [Candidatus Eremiobacteraeota bacterium]|nr:DivIVA domain-containing protein [Candidatus Eremiobacteraeota bacterium]